MSISVMEDGAITSRDENNVTTTFRLRDECKISTQLGRKYDGKVTKVKETSLVINGRILLFSDIKTLELA
ncbi:MAG: hypothetical protein K6G01_08345 [Eubacterium sp.]|nr:hypothetical protein [Eubacterium sp.]